MKLNIEYLVIQATNRLHHRPTLAFCENMQSALAVYTQLRCSDKDRAVYLLDVATTSNGAPRPALIHGHAGFVKY